MSSQQKQRSKQANEGERQSKKAQPANQELIPQAEQADPVVLQRALVDPSAASPADILNLQKKYGNQAVSGLIQHKLVVGPVGDQYEQEADRVADQVMSMPAPSTSAPATSAEGSYTQRQEDEEELQMKPLAASITPVVQRQALDEEELVQGKAIAGLQRQEEEEELVQGKPLAGLQRQDEEEELLQGKAIAGVQRQEEEEELLQGKAIAGVQRQEEEEELLQGKPIAALQRQEEEEELLQGKALAGLQRQPEEEELLQGKAIAGVQRQEDEEELLQGKALAGVQRQEDEEELLQGKALAGVQRQEEEEELLQGKPVVGIQRQEEEEELLQGKPIAAMQRQEDEEELLQGKPASPVQRKDDGSFVAGSDIETRLSSRKGAGEPLPDDTRADMESRFGASFGGVQVHADGEAAELSKDLSAQAFTQGSDIYFGAGKYDPSSGSGKRLLAHELTHVVQQSSGQTVSPPEQAGAPPRVSAGASGLQRVFEEQEERQVTTQVNDGGTALGSVDTDWLDTTFTDGVDRTSAETFWHEEMKNRINASSLDQLKAVPPDPGHYQNAWDARVTELIPTATMTDLKEGPPGGATYEDAWNNKATALITIAVAGLPVTDLGRAADGAWIQDYQDTWFTDMTLRVETEILPKIVVGQDFPPVPQDVIDNHPVTVNPAIENWISAEAKDEDRVPLGRQAAAITNFPTHHAAYVTRWNNVMKERITGHIDDLDEGKLGLAAEGEVVANAIYKTHWDTEMERRIVDDVRGNIDNTSDLPKIPQAVLDNYNSTVQTQLADWVNTVVDDVDRLGQKAKEVKNLPSNPPEYHTSWDDRMKVNVETELANVPLGQKPEGVVKKNYKDHWNTLMEARINTEVCDNIQIGQDLPEIPEAVLKNYKGTVDQKIKDWVTAEVRDANRNPLGRQAPAVLNLPQTYHKLWNQEMKLWIEAKVVVEAIQDDQDLPELPKAVLEHYKDLVDPEIKGWLDHEVATEDRSDLGRAPAAVPNLPQEYHALWNSKMTERIEAVADLPKFVTIATPAEYRVAWQARVRKLIGDKVAGDGLGTSVGVDAWLEEYQTQYSDQMKARVEADAATQPLGTVSTIANEVYKNIWTEKMKAMITQAAERGDERPGGYDDWIVEYQTAWDTGSAAREKIAVKEQEYATALELGDKTGAEAVAAELEKVREARRELPPDKRRKKRKRQGRLRERWAAAQQKEKAEKEAKGKQDMLAKLKQMDTILAGLKLHLGSPITEDPGDGDVSYSFDAPPNSAQLAVVTIRHGKMDDVEDPDQKKKALVGGLLTDLKIALGA